MAMWLIWRLPLLALACSPSCSSSSPPEPTVRGEPAPEPLEAARAPTIDFTASLNPPVAVDASNTRFVAGGVRLERDGDEWTVARDLFSGQIQAAVPTAAGWLFAADPGLIAKSTSFTGDLEVVGSIPNASVLTGIETLGFLAEIADYRLYLTDGSTPPVPVAALDAYAVLGVHWLSPDHGVVRVDDGVLESHDRGHTWQPSSRVVAPFSLEGELPSQGFAWSPNPAREDVAWRRIFAAAPNAMRPDDSRPPEADFDALGGGFWVTALGTVLDPIGAVVAEPPGDDCRARGIGPLGYAECGPSYIYRPGTSWRPSPHHGYFRFGNQLTFIVSQEPCEDGDPRLCRFDLESGAQSHVALESMDGVLFLANDAAYLESADSRTVTRRDLATGAERVVLELGTAGETIQRCVLHTDGATCVIASEASGAERPIRAVAIDRASVGESFDLPSGTTWVDFADRRRGVAEGDGRLFWTIDGGRRWEPARLPPGARTGHPDVKTCIDSVCFVGEVAVRFAPLPTRDRPDARVFGPPLQPTGPMRPTFTCETAPGEASAGALAFEIETAPDGGTLVTASSRPAGSERARVARGTVAMRGDVRFREVARAGDDALVLGCAPRSPCSLFRAGGGRITLVAAMVVSIADLGGGRLAVYRAAEPAASIATTRGAIGALRPRLGAGDGFVLENGEAGVYFYARSDHRVVIVFANGTRRILEADLDRALAEPCSSNAEGLRLFPHHSGRLAFDPRTDALQYGERDSFGLTLSSATRIAVVTSAELQIVDGRACLAAVGGLVAQPDGSIAGPIELLDRSVARATCRPSGSR